jgi:hypothetical protein
MSEPEPILIPVDLLPGAPASTWQARVKLGLLLAVLSLGGCLAVLPFSYTLLKSGALLNVPAWMLPLVLGLSVTVEFFFSVVAIVLGLWLGPWLGLIPPLLHPAPSDGESVGDPMDGPLSSPSSGWQWQVLGLALATGVVLGFAIAAVAHFTDPLMPKPPRPLPHAGPLYGFLASIGAGIREEVWMRLGVLTVLASLGASLSGSKRLGPVSFWTANFVAALVFAAIHIPQASELIGLKAAVLAFVVFGNGIPGLVFGWQYRRFGLVSAMVCHFMVDVVLKVILPFLPLD